MLFFTRSTYLHLIDQPLTNPYQINYSDFTTSAGFSLAARFTREKMLASTISTTRIKIPTKSHHSMETRRVYCSNQRCMIYTPTGNATIHEATVTTKYCLKKSINISRALAPFTFRIAISFRRWLHARVTIE